MPGSRACLSVLPAGFAMSGAGLELRELLPAIPAERLLLETDAPYLLPRDLQAQTGHRGVTSPRICRISWPASRRWRGEEAQWLEAQTDANVRALFGVDS